MSGIDTDSKLTRLLGSEEEDCTSNSLGLIEQFTILEIVDLQGDVSQFIPEFEIPVSAMDNSTNFVTEDNRSAGLTALEFVEQVQSEKYIEVNFEDFTEEFNFFNITLESETIVSVLTDVVVDRVGKR